MEQPQAAPVTPRSATWRAWSEAGEAKAEGSCTTSFPPCSALAEPDLADTDAEEVGVCSAEDPHLARWGQKLMRAVVSSHKQVEFENYHPHHRRFGEAGDHLSPPARSCGDPAALGAVASFIGHGVTRVLLAPWRLLRSSAAEVADWVGEGVLRPSGHVCGSLDLQGCPEAWSASLQDAVRRALVQVLLPAAGPGLTVSVSRAASTCEGEGVEPWMHLAFEAVLPDAHDRTPALELLRLEESFGGALKLLPLLVQELCGSSGTGLSLRLAMPWD